MKNDLIYRKILLNGCQWIMWVPIFNIVKFQITIISLFLINCLPSYVWKVYSYSVSCLSVYFVTKCFNHKETWRQEFLRCLGCLNAIHLIKYFIDGTFFAKNCDKCFEVYQRQDFTPWRKLNSRKDKIGLCLNGVSLLFNLFKAPQYSETEYILLVLFLHF